MLFSTVAKLIFFHIRQFQMQNKNSSIIKLSTTFIFLSLGCLHRKIIRVRSSVLTVGHYFSQNFFNKEFVKLHSKKRWEKVSLRGRL